MIRTGWIVACIAVVLFAGCATIMNGYYTDVELKSPPKDLRVFTKDNVELPLKTKSERVESPEKQGRYTSKTLTFVRLDRASDGVLILRWDGNERRVQAEKSMTQAWAILDFVCAIVPTIVDATTGCWNRFEPLEAGFPDTLSNR